MGMARTLKCATLTQALSIETSPSWEAHGQLKREPYQCLLPGFRTNQDVIIPLGQLAIRPISVQSPDLNRHSARQKIPLNLLVAFA